MKVGVRQWIGERLAAVAVDGRTVVLPEKIKRVLYDGAGRAVGLCESVDPVDVMVTVAGLDQAEAVRIVESDRRLLKIAAKKIEAGEVTTDANGEVHVVVTR